MTSFFVDLVSNASMDYFDENTLSRFTNKMVSPIELEGDWEVAVNEIFYPHRVEKVVKTITFSLVCINTFTEKYFGRTISNNKFTYSTDMSGLAVLSKFNKTMEEAQESWNELGTEYVEFKEPPIFTIMNERVIFEAGDAIVKNNGLGFNCFVYIWFEDKNFYKIFGFDPQSFLRKAPTLSILKRTIVAENPPYTDLRPSLLFIYSDIIREHFVGDAYASVLRVLPLQIRSNAAMCNVTFPNPYYFKLKTNRLSSISIMLLDEEGEQIHFGTGRVFINLHFRKCI